MKKENIEIERKYVIELPSESDMSAMDNYKSSKIVQIYLESHKGATHRIRKRDYGDLVEYSETKKIRIDSMSAVEEESALTENEFDLLSKNIRKGSHPILKCRHTFIYLGQLFEVDVYPEWKHSAIMETELPSRDADVVFPPFIKIIREVTGKGEYSNSAMSSVFPEEIL